MKHYTILPAFFLLLIINPFTLHAQNRSAADVESLITNTWYSYAVADPENNEMFETNNPERLTLLENGQIQFTIMHSKMGKIDYVGEWEYDEAIGVLIFTMDFDGPVERQEVIIRTLNEDELIIEIPDKVTAYSTEANEKFVEMSEKTTPEMAEQPEKTNGLNINEWTGTYSFNEATLYTADEKSESYPSKGQIELYMEDGNRMIKLEENGYTDILKVTQGISIEGERHFGVVTDDPYFAGEFVFRDNGTFYYYKDKDQSTVDYHQK